MTSSNNTSAIILDDHVIIRQACREILERENIEIIWEGENGDEAIEHYIQLSPDIAVIDLSVKGANGLETIRNIRAHNEDAKIIVFSMHSDSIFISRALELGVLCYVCKTSSPKEFISAIKYALKGKTYISDELNFKIENKKLDAKFSPLFTPQQLKIFKLIVDGQSTTSIGKQLQISKKSVSMHLNKIKEKTGAKTMSDLVRLAIIMESPVKK